MVDKIEYSINHIIAPGLNGDPSIKSKFSTCLFKLSFASYYKNVEIAVDHVDDDV